jgi:hypothetical protein
MIKDGWIGGTCSIYEDDEKWIKSVGRKTHMEEITWEAGQMEG